MAIRPIRLFGDPILRTKAEPVVDFDKELRRLVRDLTDTMLDAPGAGLAAPQIGAPVRIVYAEMEKPWVLINPEIVDVGNEDFTVWDDCFSFPNLLVRVQRSFAIEEFARVSGKGHAADIGAAAVRADPRQPARRHRARRPLVHRRQGRGAPRVLRAADRRPLRRGGRGLLSCEVRGHATGVRAVHEELVAIWIRRRGVGALGRDRGGHRPPRRPPPPSPRKSVKGAAEFSEGGSAAGAVEHRFDHGVLPGGHAPGTGKPHTRAGGQIDLGYGVVLAAGGGDGGFLGLGLRHGIAPKRGYDPFPRATQAFAVAAESEPARPRGMRPVARVTRGAPSVLRRVGSMQTLI